MLKNHIKIALRSLKKQKGYSIINIAGLSISLAVSLLMLLWVQDEWATDKFHENGDQIFRVKRTIPLENNVLDVYRGVPYQILNTAVKEIPEVEKFFPIGFTFEDNLQKDDQAFRAKGTFANASLFEILSFPIIQGDVSQLDQKVNSMVISESLAKKIFGNTWKSNALGQTIHIHDNGDFSIAAIYEDFPEKSTLQNDFYYSFKSHLAKNDWMLDWGNSGMQGGVLLAAGSDPIAVGKKIDKMFKNNQKEGNKEGAFLQLFGDDHLYGNFDEQAQVVGGRIEYVRTFGIAAFLLLLISCINFVNLSTARASKRAKEVGVRKTIGAGKKSLISQFMIEAGVVTLISVGIAFLLAQALLPSVQKITDKMLIFDYAQPVFWFGITGVIILTTLFSGAYPAFVLSEFKPINALKGKVNQQTGSVNFRKSLVVVQFVLSLLLIIGSVIVTQQVDFIQNKNLGIAKDNLLYIHQDKVMYESYDVLKNELISKDGIEDVTLVGPNPLDIGSSTSSLSWPGKRPDQSKIEFKLLWTASNFVDVFDVNLSEGAYYRSGEILDTTKIVLNERAIEIMGIEDPIGKTITFWQAPRQIIGVIKDFHNQPLHQKIEPTCFLLNQEDAGWFYVKAKEGEMASAISGLESSFEKILPEVPLHYNFLDEQYQRQYKSEILTGKLANYFAIISIFISCLGLLGLATFLAEQKTKEIGIRKILGASTIGIIRLLSKDFIKLVVLALIISIPIAYYFMTSWLAAFEYHISIKWWVFALSGIAAILVAFLTVGIQSTRAALVNPVDSIRGE